MCEWLCGYPRWVVLLCLVHCYSSFLPSCMALSFTEIVNQLNALSCLHGDDDDDDGGGVLKRARKATAKPAASSQGLFSPFFTSLPVFLFFFHRLVNVVSPLHYHSLPQCLSIYLFLILTFSAFLSFCFSFSNPPILLLHWYCDGVMVMWSYNLSWSKW